MKCNMCGGSTTEVKEIKQAKYRDEVVEVETTLFRCDSCKEGFVTPQQMREHVRTVKNEVRKKHGLLSPARIAEIRAKLELSQEELEQLLNTGPKVVVRWESGKVIQGSGHDTTLRLLERDPSVVRDLRLIQEERGKEQRRYEKAHRSTSFMTAGATRA